MRYSPEEERELAVVERTEAFFTSEMRLQADNPPGKDNGTQAFAVAMETIYREKMNPVLVGSITRAIRERFYQTPEYLFNLSVRAFQKLLLRDAGEYFFPQEFYDVDVWIDSIDRIMDDDALRQEWMHDMLTREVQSNVSERYKSLVPIILAMQAAGRFGPNPRILDVGTSQMVGLKKLVSKDYPFEPIRVGRAVEWNIQREANLVVDDELTRRTNRLLARPLSLGRCVGIDIVPVDDIEAREWTEACSFYVTEREDEELVAQWRSLADNPVDGAEFVQADITKGLPPGIEKGSFDMVVYLTMLYQLTPRCRTSALNVGSEYATESGLVVATDFMSVPPDNPTRLDFAEHFHTRPYAYTTAVLDNKDKSLGFQEVYKWSNGRCREALIGDLAVAGSISKAVHDYLNHQLLDDPNR